MMVKLIPDDGFRPEYECPPGQTVNSGDQNDGGGVESLGFFLAYFFEHIRENADMVRLFDRALKDCYGRRA